MYVTHLWIQRDSIKRRVRTSCKLNILTTFHWTKWGGSSGINWHQIKCLTQADNYSDQRVVASHTLLVFHLFPPWWLIIYGIGYKWRNATNWRLVGKEEDLCEGCSTQKPSARKPRLSRHRQWWWSNRLLVLGPHAIASQSSANRTKFLSGEC